MSRLYHIVPPALRGDVLYPLHELAGRFPDLAAEAARKYSGRERLMDVVIPVLGCRWNDVLHLTPLHPTKTRQALEAAGFATDDRAFFAIPTDALADGRAVFFENSRDTGGAYDFKESDFSPFTLAAYRELQDVPDSQARYFAEKKRDGGRPLLWARTPHVFYRGSIDVRRLETVSW